MKKYKRDKRSPLPSSENASKVMSSIKRKNTTPEILFRKLLWAKGLRGYRIHVNLPGKPDIAFLNKKIAIFIHGCYWHRCPKCKLPFPKSNSHFWIAKFNRNIERDKKKEEQLKESGWKVFVYWECDIKTKPSILVNQVECLINTC